MSKEHPFPHTSAIVTGGSGGIGRVVAQRLASDGFAVTVQFAGNQAAAEETVALIRKAGGKALALRADVNEPADVKALYVAAMQSHEHGKLGVVVNCAGIMNLKPIAEGDVESFDRIIATNLRGTFLMMSEAARHLDEGGRFIAVSSSVLGVNFPGYGPYIASKAGVEGLVRVFANELRGRGVTVNAVAPGPVATELFFAGKSDEQVQRLAKMPPLERLGTPEDMAGVVSFLAGPDGSWVNGQVLRANGGFA